MNVARRWLNRAGGVFLFVVALAILALVVLRLTAPMYPATPAIAHAGGRIEGRDYTNSLAAFDLAYAKGFRIIEVDFQKTSDDVVVCGHDWDKYAAAPSYAEFTEIRAQDGLAACIVSDVIAWLEAHPDVQMMSDAKSDVLAINDMLHGLLGDRLIAQAYTADQVAQLRELGISHIILTLYRLGNLGRKIAELEKLVASGLGIDAVTMPIIDALTGTALLAKHRLGTPVYSHTVNSCFLLSLLWGMGVDAIYTDDLPPHGCGAKENSETKTT